MIMTANNYNFYVRPTIGYSLACESNGQTRQEAQAAFENRIGYPIDGQAAGARICAIFLLSFGLLFTFAFTPTFSPDEIGSAKCIPVMFCLIFILYLPLIIFY